MSPETLAQALGRIPSGIFVVTCRDSGRDYAMLASWVQQAGFDPPCVSLAVAAGRPVQSLLEAGHPFVLHLLGEDQQAILRQFAKPADTPEALFEGRVIERREDGLPVLSEALGHLVCRPRASVPAGDHTLWIAEVVEGQLRDSSRPMVHIRKSGKHY